MEEHVVVETGSTAIEISLELDQVRLYFSNDQEGEYVLELTTEEYLDLCGGVREVYREVKRRRRAIGGY